MMQKRTLEPSSKIPPRPPSSHSMVIICITGDPVNKCYEKVCSALCVQGDVCRLFVLPVEHDNLELFPWTIDALHMHHDADITIGAKTSIADNCIGQLWIFLALATNRINFGVVL